MRYILSLIKRERVSEVRAKEAGAMAPCEHCLTSLQWQLEGHVTIHPSGPYKITRFRSNLYN